MLLRDGDERIRPRLPFLARTRRPIDRPGHDQRLCQTERMTELARLLDRRVASEARLIEVAKTKQVDTRGKRAG